MRWLLALAVLGGCAVLDSVSDFFTASEEAAQRTADLAETVDYIINDAWLLLAGYLGGRGTEVAGKRLYKRINGRKKKKT